MTILKDIIKEIKEKYQDHEEGFKYAIGRLEQVLEHEGITLEHLRDYAAADAEECKRRTEYHKQPAVSRFYSVKVSTSLQDEAVVMEDVAQLPQK